MKGLTRRCDWQLPNGTCCGRRAARSYVYWVLGSKGGSIRMARCHRHLMDQSRAVADGWMVVAA